MPTTLPPISKSAPGRVVRLLPPPSQTPNAALEGYRHRIMTERSASLASRLPQEVPLLDAKVRAFMGQRAEARYGNNRSAALGTLQPTPHPAAYEMTPSHDPATSIYHGRQKTQFFYEGGVADCFRDDAEENDRKAGRERIRQLKKAIRDERSARKEMERDAKCSGIIVDSALPRDWFETLDANQQTVWMHRITQHVSKLRPTKDTPIAPVHMALKAQVDLPPGWFETRDVKGKTVWRHIDSTEVRAHRTLASRTCARGDAGRDYSQSPHLPLSPV
jgi:hypothetical protein